MEKSSHFKTLINNTFYDTLEDDWYEAKDHPIALLRAENNIRAPWVSQEIDTLLGKKQHILDIGCGAGFLSNHLAKEGHIVTGIDLSESSLKTAKKYDATRSVNYVLANAYRLPFEDASFDVVCAMDILEHVEIPCQIIHEASRVLKPRGLFFFHTFNRNLWSYLIVIKGVDWFVKNAPKNMHVYELFIKPSELKILCEEKGLFVEKLLGFMPKIASSAFFKLLLTRTVPESFQFSFSSSCLAGYCGFARKHIFA